MEAANTARPLSRQPSLDCLGLTGSDPRGQRLPTQQFHDSM
jgi:hypothetical protein